ncbi:MAG: hypothetical protein A2X08_16055 [Bacteroidetes bacterium GWA2_32_17]|nr:MAG: hypothetical protein A2X08_16055 [Bacteroidetes bacterium GWA2_32_17]
MRYKKVKLSALLLLGIGLSGIQAQSTLYVKEHSGIQTPYTLSSIRKLTFPTGNMTVKKTDGSTNTFALSDIRYLNFIDLTTNVSQVGIQENSSIILYPNPVIDQLQISYESIKAWNVQVEIIDVQGKVLHQQTIISKNGTNHALIPVSQLSKGLYVCRLQSNEKIEIFKFLK